MYRSLWYYYKTYIRRDLLGHINLQRRDKVGVISYIKVIIDLVNVNSVEDLKILKTVDFIENITGQKCMVKDLGNIQGKRGYSTGKHLLCFVTLRKRKLYNFISYLTILVLPIYIKRYGFPKLNDMGGGIYMIELNDMNIFYKLKLNLFIEDKVRILIKMEGHKLNHKYLLHSLGFKFI